MITPTSVSSRLSARPVTPWPRSIISFSIASARPSTRATPSPISRITPTLCLAAFAFAPVISASISCSKLLIRTSAEAFLQRGERRPNASVVDVAADLDAHPPDQRGVLREAHAHARPVGAAESRLDLGPELGRKGRGALDECAVAFLVQPDEPAEVRQDREAAATPAAGNSSGHMARAALVEQSRGQACPEEPPGSPSSSFGRAHVRVARAS